MVIKKFKPANLQLYDHREPMEIILLKSDVPGYGPHNKAISLGKVHEFIYFVKDQHIDIHVCPGYYDSDDHEHEISITRDKKFSRKVGFEIVMPDIDLKQRFTQEELGVDSVEKSKDVLMELIDQIVNENYKDFYHEKHGLWITRTVE